MDCVAPVPSPERVEEEELLLHANHAVVPLLGLLQDVQVLLRKGGRGGGGRKVVSTLLSTRTQD